MPRRWKLLIVIAFVVVLLDQWTKFLAVKHLTSGLAQAHSESSGAPIETGGSLTLFQELGYFFGEVEHPCRKSGARCPTKILIEKRWAWAYAENPGAAWSFLANAGENIRIPFFLGVSILAIGLILWFFHRLESQQKLLMLALSLVLGGAIGNFIDRVRLSYVIDFIVWWVGSYRWPTFNVADSAISVGVGMMVLDSILDTVRARNAKKQGAAAEAKGGARASEGP